MRFESFEFAHWQVGYEDCTRYRSQNRRVGSGRFGSFAARVEVNLAVSQAE